MSWRCGTLSSSMEMGDEGLKSAFVVSVHHNRPQHQHPLHHFDSATLSSQYPKEMHEPQCPTIACCAGAYRFPHGLALSRPAHGLRLVLDAIKFIAAKDPTSRVAISRIRCPRAAAFGEGEFERTAKLD